MERYLVTFTAIEWDADPRDYPDANLPTEYALCVDADSPDDAREIAADRMSDNTGFLFYGAQTSINTVYTKTC